MDEILRSPYSRRLLRDHIAELAEAEVVPLVAVAQNGSALESGPTTV